MSIAVVTLLSLAILVVGFLVGWLVGGLAAGWNVIAFMALPVLVIGFLVGWLVEWIIDNQYRRMRELARSTIAAPQPTSYPAPAASGEVTELIGTLKGVLSEREEEMDDLRAELKRREAAVERLRGEYNDYVSAHPDDLTAIKGIGRIYQWKLRDAGINTYEDLAGSTPERIRQVLEAKEWQRLDPSSWIEQAQALLKRGD